MLESYLTFFIFFNLFQPFYFNLLATLEPEEFDPNEVLRRAALEKAREEGIKPEDVVIPEIKMEHFSDSEEDEKLSFRDEKVIRRRKDFFSFKISKFNLLMTGLSISQGLANPLKAKI